MARVPTGARTFIDERPDDALLARVEEWGTEVPIFVFRTELGVTACYDPRTERAWVPKYLETEDE